MMDKLKKFISKYTFPIHLFVINRKLLIRLRYTIWSAYNKTRLRLLGAAVGSGFRSDGQIYIRTQKRGQIDIGQKVCLLSHPGTNLVGLTNPCVLHCHRDGQIVIGDHSGGSAVILSSKSSISLGRYVKLGGNVRVFDHDYHALDYQSRRNGATDKANCRTKPVTIGDDVFVGTNSIILKGVTIGDRSIIGAGSVVTSDVPPDEVWAGNPARNVKGLK
jgi:acetyltransferase-like isoleucine patch superfamily enzyme